MTDNLIDTSKVYQEFTSDVLKQKETYSIGDCLIEVVDNKDIPLQFFSNILLMKEKEKGMYTKKMFLKMEDETEILGSYSEENLQNVYLLCKEFTSEKSNKIKLYNFEKYNLSMLLSLKGIFE